MKSLLLQLFAAVAVAAATATVAQAHDIGNAAAITPAEAAADFERELQSSFKCPIPTSGCSNGMFNQAKCECECISPFCPDMNGDCTNPSNNCGGNKWARCTKGVNCPWWSNVLKAESCTTGPNVSLIFTRAEMCRARPLPGDGHHLMCCVVHYFISVCCEPTAV